MDWIKMRNGLWQQLQVLALAERLGCSDNEAIGLLLRFWCLVREEHEDGVLPAYSEGLIDRHVGRPGFAKALLAGLDGNGLKAWMRVSEGGMYVPDADRWIGSGRIDREATKERVRRWRERNGDVTPRNGDVTRYKRVSNTAEKRREEKKREEKDTNTRAPRARRERVCSSPDSDFAGGQESTFDAIATTIAQDASETAQATIVATANPDAPAGQETALAVNVAGSTSDLFDRWWAIYPRRVGRAAAKRAFAERVARMDSEGVARVLRATQKYANSPLVRDLVARGEVRYIPHPGTWIIQERYQDDASDWQHTHTGQPPVTGGEQLRQRGRESGFESDRAIYDNLPISGGGGGPAPG